MGLKKGIFQQSKEICSKHKIRKLIICGKEYCGLCEIEEKEEELSKQRDANIDHDRLKQYNEEKLKKKRKRGR